MMELKPFEPQDAHRIKSLTDSWIGLNYFSEAELQEMSQRSVKNGQNCSFLVVVDGEIKGFRFTYPPGQWVSGKGEGLSEELWPHSKSETAYFQSLYVHPDCLKKGYGKKLSLKSIEVLKKVGAKGVVCHSWVESPNNSSFLYLSSIGFKSIALHKEYWKDVEY
ncbi:MAG: GNAT family N-acetyltransferase, partial [Bdellovibrionales bacterium]|nr:GNAT family N-acetyltransferase [Bdellovibrionales bacterium]NQZ19634.1 GNAT family N-acetyltransferase [Bdellovibrionales bacterium]